MDRLTARFEVSFELCSTTADVVCALERFHPLSERTLGSGDGFCRGITDLRHGGRLYILRAPDQPLPDQFRVDLNFSLSIVEEGSDDQSGLQEVYWPYGGVNRPKRHYHKRSVLGV
jgi:hypothetical protein